MLMLTYGNPAKAPPPPVPTSFTIRRIARRAERARQMGAPHQPIAARCCMPNPMPAACPPPRMDRPPPTPDPRMAKTGLSLPRRALSRPHDTRIAYRGRRHGRVRSRLAGRSAGHPRGDPRDAAQGRHFRPPHRHLAEMVCSNSFRSDDDEQNAVGLLHWEMRAAGGLIMEMADRHKLPAGGALAVDRDPFAEAVTERLKAHPNVTVEGAEITELPEDGARGSSRPARSPPARLAEAIARETGPGQPRLLRRHRAHRLCRHDRHVGGVGAVPLRQGRHRRGTHGLYQLPDDEATSTRPSSTRCSPPTRPSSNPGKPPAISTAACPSR
jgi:hypothetical protein